MSSFIITYMDVPEGIQRIEADQYCLDGNGWMDFFVEGNDDDLLVASVRVDLIRSIELDQGALSRIG